MSISEAIEKKLTDALNPERLAVLNESHLHAGHQPSFDGSGETIGGLSLAILNFWTEFHYK